MADWTERRVTLPDAIVARFRLVAHDRIQQLELAWSRVVADPTDTEASALLHRETHTLKGEARMVGFEEINQVCHKLEDLLGLARANAYRIDGELDLVVAMALQFMGLLLRKQDGGSIDGIDLPAFVRQADAVIAGARGPMKPRTTTSPIARIEIDRPKETVAGPSRDRLAETALDIWLELKAGQGTRRLQRAWVTLRDLLAPSSPVPIAPQLAKHESGALDLARELGKDVELAFELDAGTAAPAIVTALDLAVLHLVRNAIDHGIEPPDVRRAGGKPSRGRVIIRCTAGAEQVKLVITDDGHGIDFPRVRSRGIALGLIDPAAAPTDDELAGLLMEPGFSTRKVTTEVSGRGIGLDAVKTAIHALGGYIGVRSMLGDGTTWTIEVPTPRRRLPVRRFAVRDRALAFAVTSDWSASVVPQRADAIDLVDELRLGGREQASPITLQLERGGTVVKLAASGPPVEAEARLLVATPADAPGDIVAIDGVEHLLIRPAQLARVSGTVLIVDDSDICRDLVRLSLAPLGIDVVMLDDPAPLLGTLGARTVDLLLLDLSFRGLDLAKLVAEVRHGVPDCLIYLHSDRTPGQLEEIAARVKADGHLSKTLGTERFVARVARILRAHRAERGSSRSAS